MPDVRSPHHLDSISLGELLRARAERTPEKVAYRFLKESGDEDLTYAALHAQASAVASTLRASGAAGSPVILAYPSGLAFIAAMFGCLYAGAIAVPVSVAPRGTTRVAIGQRRWHIARDTGATLALGDQEVGPDLAAAGNQLAGDLRWVLTGDPRDAAGPVDTPERVPDPDAPVLVQYSSGSTTDPKGVVLTHRQLLANLAMWQEAYRLTDAAVLINWLPHYHDLGLVGHLLLAMYLGAPCATMDPLTFVGHPERWLHAVTKYRGTFSGAPNFGYELCINKITEEKKRDLDLRSWRVAVNAAEPVRERTLRRFAAAFEPCGFRAESMCPAYGLAEAAALVTGGEGVAPAGVRCFAQSELSRGRAVALPAGSEGRWLVGCGRALGGGDLAIVDSDRLVACPPGTVGEIWVSCPSVAVGYWQKPAETAATFGARLPGADGAGEKTYLRTGDLGFVLDGQLYVTGRQKDTLIVRGAVHYPQDIEQSAEAAHPAFRAGGAAAFQIDDGEQERLIVLQEVEPSRFTKEAIPECLRAIRSAIAEEHGLLVHTVCLLERGGILKTTSGKIRRAPCRAAFLDGSLPVLGRSDAERTAQPPEERSLSRVELLALAPEERRLRLHDYVLDQLARELQLSPEHSRELRAESSLISQGMDSLIATNLVQRIERALGVALRLEDLLLGASAAQTAETIAASLAATVPSGEVEEFIV